MPEVMQFVPILAVGFAMALGLTPLSRQIAMRFGVVDKPNQRKIHLDHKPLMGGLAIYVALALAVLLFSPPRHLRELGAVLAGAAALALVGLLDDRYGLSARLRLGVQALAALGLVAFGIRMNLTGLLLPDAALTVLWVVALTNAANFMDNMDGLTAGFSAVAAFFFLTIAISQGLSLVSSLAAALLGSALGFLVYNFNPSSTFMGDMGALPLGFILGVLALKIQFEQPLSVYWLSPVLVLALPLFDLNLVVLTRLLEGRSPAQAGKDHTSHRLLSAGFSQRQTLFVLGLACALFGALGFFVSAAPPEVALRLGVFGLLLLAALFILMIWMRRRFQQPARTTADPSLAEPSR